MAEMIIKKSVERELHTCESRRTGDWIVFTCPKCDYELRDNVRTGELTVSNSKADVYHSGIHHPIEYTEGSESIH